MRPAEVHAVVLAGGLGTRLRRVLADRPKPMADVAGRPFLEWVLRYLQGQGVRHVTLSTGHFAEMITAYFQRQPVAGLNVTCEAEPAPLGTGGGFLHTAKQVIAQRGSAPAGWLVLNGDSLFLVELAGLMEKWREQGTPGAILAREVDDVQRYGEVTFDARGRLVRFAEKAPGAEKRRGWINAGVYLFTPALVDKFPQPFDPARPALSFEYDVFPAWLRQGESLAVLPGTGAFLDIGTEETLAAAEAFVEAQRNYFS